MARPDTSRSASVDDNSMLMVDAPDESHDTSGAENGNGAMDSYQDTPDYTDSDTNPNTTASSVAGDAHIDGRKRRSEAFALRKRIMSKKHGELGESKDSDAMRRFRYLLGLTDLFRHFIDASSNPKVREIMAEIDRRNAEEASRKSKANDRTGGATGRQRRSEKEEDAELIQNERRGEQLTVFRESPVFIHGEMRDYQIEGLNWLVSLHENGISGILADEMGLGKTLQTIAFLGYLKNYCEITGPHLIAVPKSTLNNWEREFNQWTPGVNVLVLQGAKEDRHQLINERLNEEAFDVCVTSYEMILREKTHLKKIAWRYIIIDEAHRIKNEESSLARNMREFNSQNRLLITGTPLQNNLHELWALLNFLLPDVFSDSDAFDEWFSSQNEDEDTVIQQLHRVLKPFLLRRVKADVEKSLLPKKEIQIPVGMTEMQVKWYKKILEKDIDAVNGAGGRRESKTRLLNIVMQLRKCCNHPYLFDGAEPGPPYTTDEHLVFNAGKMKVLDKLLRKMKAQDSRVLIFSQMSRVLDILEDYCVFREHAYCRIDGGTAHEDRIAAIDEYNKPNSEKFIFLLTTRAGGLGINLTSADIVVLFDSDWNPQADLQAQDRAHRIGQTKQVVVYRFVTEKAIEERVLERAAQKLRLDQVVIQQGRAQHGTGQAASKDELLEMIQHGAESIFQSKDPSMASGKDVTDEDLDTLLARGEQRTKELNSKYEKLGLDELQNFTSNNALQWDGVDWTKKERKELGINWIHPSKRERKEQAYSIDGYYRKALATGGRTADDKPKAPRAPRQVMIHDWQFFDPRLEEIQDRETAYYRKLIGYKVPLPDREDMTDAEKEAERDLEQQEIDNAVPLTDEEKQLKEELTNQGFPEWNKRDFQQFINGSAKYGRRNWEGIAIEVDGKDAKQIKTYAETFWKRYTELADHQKFLDNIRRGEEGRDKVEHQRKILKKKLDMYRVPLQQMKLNYSVSTTNKKVYTEEEDRFLLVMLGKYGLDSEGVNESIRDEIRDSPLFRFDWFFLSRTPMELGRRITTLLNTITKEFDDGKETNGIVKSRARDDDDEQEEQNGPKQKRAKTAKNKQVSAVKNGSKATTARTSRATSVTSTGSASKGKGKGRKKAAAAAAAAA